jgi:hypothetical protein
MLQSTGAVCNARAFALSSPPWNTEAREDSAMSDESRLDRVYSFIMKRMTETGRAPFYTDIAAELEIPVEEGRKALHDLLATGIPGWVFPNTDYIVSLAPFNNLPTQYRITIDGEQKWFAQ